MSVTEEVAVLYVAGQSSEGFFERTMSSVRRVVGKRAALNRVRVEPFDVVVAEYDLPDGDGLEVLSSIRETAPDTPLVLYAEETPEAIETAGYEDTVVEYVPKSAGAGTLARVVSDVAGDRRHRSYPVPENEDERLDVVAQYDIAGMQARSALDRLARISARHYDAAMSFVGLVDDREERVLACVGVEWERLHREETVCTYGIMEDDVFVVKDLTADERFANVPAVTEDGMEFYAGAPINPEGETIGMFCVLDDEPRTFDDVERETLSMFAAEAAEQLRLRRDAGPTTQ